jgi:hypothetical protein
VGGCSAALAARWVVPRHAVLQERALGSRSCELALLLCMQGQAQSGDATARRLPVYHHSPLMRRQQRLQHAKQRKRQWLLKMYRLGAGTPQATAEQLSGASGGPLPDLGAEAGDAELDAWIEQLAGSQAPAEVAPAGAPPALLRWAQLLDYDDYMSSWTGAACSLGSEALLPLSDMDLMAALLAEDVEAGGTAGGAPPPGFAGSSGGLDAIRSAGVCLSLADAAARLGLGQQRCPGLAALQPAAGGGGGVVVA